MDRQFGNKQKLEHAGEVRQSQLISTFGIGSIIDFVRDTVMVAGVDDWESEGWEERKLFNNNLQAITEVEHFLAPKIAANMGYVKSNDVLSYVFPQKLYCPICKHIIDARELGNQQKKHNCFMPNAKSGKPCGGHLVASRFVIVCPNGHIEDFPYSWWVHHGGSCEKSKSNNSRIKMYNVEDRSDIGSLTIKCEECGKTRRMEFAFSRNALAGDNGYRCHGKHPHLGNDFTSECNETMIARLRSSSSVYFPAILSALTIPPWSRKAVQIIESKYEELADRVQYGEEAVSNYIKEKILPRTKNPITFFDLMSAYNLVKEQKNSPSMQTEADIFVAEYDVLCRGEMSDEEYVASVGEVPSGFEGIIEAITVLDKLTVINAMLGFTRINPWDGTLENNVSLVPLSKEKKSWLPAVKLLGEGIFIKFNETAISKWEKQIGNRYQEMAGELAASYLENERFSPKYVALHTFAHLFIRQLADDCGYSASAIKEKIYSTYSDESNRSNMCGVLVYLSTSDSEGSLGGLISIANDPTRLQAVLKNMLHKAMWCSADPLCCNSTQQGFHSLNYAACHDCVLLPETSCEFRNVLLDRVSIVGKLGNPQMGLFGEIANLLMKGE